MEQKQIDRINELARKAKTPEGLTEWEGGEGRGRPWQEGRSDRSGLGRRARGRQEWPWLEGDRDRGADR